jgi:hypothetical protein
MQPQVEAAIVSGICGIVSVAIGIFQEEIRSVLHLCVKRLLSHSLHGSKRSDCLGRSYAVRVQRACADVVRAEMFWHLRAEMTRLILNQTFAT